METEVHVYAFSIAANVLLSFFPFLVFIVSLFRYVFHWRGAIDAVYLAINDFFPGAVGDLVSRNLKICVADRGSVGFFSLLLLLFTANGVFEPMEVALNRVWGITKNRTFLKNQAVSLGLIFACGALALLSSSLTAFNLQSLNLIPGAFADVLRIAIYKAAAVPISITILCLIYWLLPNAKIPVRQVMPPAIIVGVLLEVLKYVNLLTLPLLLHKFTLEYGPFVNSVTIILWSFIASLLVLAGAEWSARTGRTKVPADSSKFLSIRA